MKTQSKTMLCSNAVICQNHFRHQNSLNNCSMCLHRVKKYQMPTMKALVQEFPMNVLSENTKALKSKSTIN